MAAVFLAARQPPHGCAAHISVLWIGRERNGSFGQYPAQLGKLSNHSRTLSFPHGRNCGRRWVPLVLICAALRERMQVKLNCSFHPLQCVQSQIFLFHVYSRTFLLDTWTSTKAVLSTGYCLRWCSLGAPRIQQRGTGTSSLTTSGSTFGTKVYMPIN